LLNPLEIPALGHKPAATQHQEEELRELVAERASRNIEALKLYEPTPFQQRFHECTLKERLLQAGNQALRDDEPVLTPHGWAAIGSLIPGDDVIGGDGRTCQVTGVYPQGAEKMYRVHTGDGTSVVCSAGHLWEVQYVQDRVAGKRRVVTTMELKAYTDKHREQSLARVGRVCFNRPQVRQTPIEFSHRPVLLEPYAVGILIGDGGLTGNAPKVHTIDRELVDAVVAADGSHSVEAVKDRGERSVAWVLSQKNKRCGSRKNPLTQALKLIGIHGKRAWEKHIPHQYLFNSAAVRLEVLRGLLDTDGHIDKRGKIEYSSASRRLAEDAAFIVRSLGGYASIATKSTVYTSPNQPTKKAGRPAHRLYIWMPPHLCPFRLRRKADRFQDRAGGTRTIDRVEECGESSCTCISVNSTCETFFTRDLLLTHNTGKSIAAFVEDARAVTGQDPYDKYPKENGILAIIGLDEKHIGKVVHKYLFKSGAFKIIRDKETKQWRCYKPWNEDDAKRQAEAKPAPPLIPHRFIKGGYSKGIAWVQKKTGVFAQVELVTGWVIYAFSSKGEPAAGFQADLVHIDEDIARPDWYDEMIARLTMRSGRLIWSALPLSKNDALVNLADRCAKHAIREANEQDDPSIPADQKFKSSTAVFRARIFDNPFMPKKEMEENIARWRATSEDEYRKRALGELVTDSYLMYPTFHQDIHEAVRKDATAVEAQKILVEHKGVPPADWCRYLVVDPGHTICAVEFLAVPPQKFGDYAVVYDELYIERCDAEMFGEAVQNKVRDDTFEAFIIDAHGGRLREIGGGETPKQRYEAQFRKRGIKSVATGHNFLHGSDDVKGRETILREWLVVRKDGTPKLLVVTNKCPNLCFEMSRFKKKVSALGVVTDDGDRRRYSHAVECIEYAVAHGLPYRKPPTKVHAETWIQRILREQNLRRAANAAKGWGLGPTPHISLGPQGVST
jgi:hypothetical protein